MCLEILLEDGGFPVGEWICKCRLVLHEELRVECRVKLLVLGRRLDHVIKIIIQLLRLINQHLKIVLLIIRPVEPVDQDGADNLVVLQEGVPLLEGATSDLQLVVG